MSKPQLFISYRSLDRPVVAQLVAAIEADGRYAVWYDQSLAHQGGRSWWDEILAAIRASDVVVLALSNAMLESEPCRRERLYAQELERPLLPLSIDPELDYAQLPQSLVSRQILTYDGTADSFVALLRSVEGLLPAPTLPDPLPTPPDVPISGLSQVLQLLEAPRLTPTEQRQVVDRIRWLYIETPQDAPQLREALHKLNSKPDLIADVRQSLVTLSHEMRPEPKPGASTRRIALTAFAIFAFAMVVTVAVVLSSTRQNSPATTPKDQPVNTPGATQEIQPTSDVNTYDVTVAHGGTDSLTLLVNTKSNLSNIALLASQERIMLRDEFDSLTATGMVANAGTCLRFAREGTQPVSLRGCHQSLDRVIAAADVFWYDDADNRPIDVIITDGNRQAVCSAAQVRCEFTTETTNDER